MVLPEPDSAAGWVQRIRDQDMPAFGATVALIHSITEDDSASTDRLARVILQDAAMTTKVLKLANSAFYNPARQTISTISRAIVVLGFNVVAEMSVGIQLVDALLAGGARQRVVDEMARSFHAAVLARALAGMRGDGHSEEVFIAALLSRVGEMAFWAFGGQTAARLDTLISAGESPPEDVQQAVLGFRLRQISLGLAREWKLGPLLLASLEGGRRASIAEGTVRHALDLAREALDDWRPESSREVIVEAAKFVHRSEEVLRDELAELAAEAARVAMNFGAGDAARRIALTSRRDPALDEEPPPAETLAPDPGLQLRILRELSGLVAEGAGLSEVMSLVLEGILRGVGFDRVLFALLTPNRQQLVGKAGLGREVESLHKRFVFALDGTRGDVFNEFFLCPRALRLAPGEAPRGVKLSRLHAVAGDRPACLAPIRFQGQVIGAVYADRVDVGGAVDDEAFEAFQLFVQQLSLAVVPAPVKSRKL